MGGDIGMHVGANIVESFPDRVYHATLIPSLVQAKRLGEKTGAGFYKYDAKRKAQADPEGLAPFLAAARAKNTVRPLRGWAMRSSMSLAPLSLPAPAHTDAEAWEHERR